MVNEEKIIELFENPRFQKHSIFFYQERRTVTEVEELSGISRQTIYNHFKKFKDNDHPNPDFLKGYAGSSNIPYIFEHKLPVLFLGELADLSKKEKEILEENLENTKLGEVTRTADSWKEVFGIIVFSVILAKIKKKMRAKAEKTAGLFTNEDLREYSFFRGLSGKAAGDFMGATEKMSKNKSVVQAGQKIIDSDIPIGLTSKDWERIWMGLFDEAQNLAKELKNNGKT